MTKRTINIAERPSSFPWPPVLLAGACLGAWLLGRIHALPWPGIADVAAHVIGVGLGVAGLIVFAWAATTLGRHATTIRPDKGADRLVTDGPFRFVRNPIYLADVLMLLGVAELTQNVWFVILAALFAALVTWLAILPEERHLGEKFGDAYRDYTARTRRWI
jgi:protein-S-isoprenylcysteine O-methyltransferase Ste14